jgi:hypothetical protein
MSSRARWFTSALTGSVLALAALTFSGDSRGAKANTFTIEYAPLAFKIAIAVPEEGHLCIILPESAQEPTACMGLDPSAMVDALPEGPDRPFGAAIARMGEWSYIVMISPLAEEIEAREDIDKFVAEAAKPDPDQPGVTPRLVGPSPAQTYEILKANDVPIVKFRLDSGVPPSSPTYDLSTIVNYAGFGSKAALVSFITSPKDVDRVMPYAEATIQSMALPPRESPERFGKPRAELERSGTRLAIMVLGPLVALGALLFLWLARGKKEDDAAPPGEKTGDEPAPSREEHADDPSPSRDKTGDGEK